jgi:hypothetical protein
LSEQVDQLGREQADHEAIIRALASAEVRFLLAGGMAVQAHGYLRFTFDVDIIPSPDRANMVRLAAALIGMDAAAVDAHGNRLTLDLSHPESLALGNYFLTTEHGALDLFNGPRPDVKRYDRLDEAAIEASLGGVTVRVIGKDDLIAMKREAGRDKDLADIAALTEAERRRDELSDARD